MRLHDSGLGVRPALTNDAVKSGGESFSDCMTWFIHVMQSENNYRLI